MTAETYLPFIAPFLLLAFGSAMYAALVRMEERTRVQLQPVRIRSREPRS